MTANLYITPATRQYLADRRAEARRIVLNGGAHTDSQIRLAWHVLTGMPAHMKAQAAASRIERGRADDGPGCA